MFYQLLPNFRLFDQTYFEGKNYLDIIKNNKPFDWNCNRYFKVSTRRNFWFYIYFYYLNAYVPDNIITIFKTM